MEPKIIAGFNKEGILDFIKKTNEFCKNGKIFESAGIYFKPNLKFQLVLNDAVDFIGYYVDCAEEMYEYRWATRLNEISDLFLFKTKLYFDIEEKLILKQSR